MLERKNAQPLYVQARNVLQARIENGEYKENEKIPSESELCKEFGISRMTVRSVLTELVRDGKLYRIQGKGTFVAEPKLVASTMAYVGIREQLEKQGYDVSTVVMEVQIIDCPTSVAKIMDLEPDDQVYYVLRTRSMDGVPLGIHKSYIPVKLCAGLECNDFCNDQLCTILCKNYGLVRAKVTESLESVAATEEEAGLLKIKKGYPLLLLCDTISDKSGRVFEYSTVVFRGDKMKISLQYGI